MFKIGFIHFGMFQLLNDNSVIFYRICMFCVITEISKKINNPDDPTL